MASASLTEISPYDDVLLDDVMAYLGKRAPVVSYAAGDVIVTTGESATDFRVVLDGQVEIMLADESGTQLRLATGRKGCFFGEMSLLTNSPASATVVARAPTQVLCCPPELFLKALAECPSLRQCILTALASRVQNGNTRMWELFRRLRAHVALLRLDQSVGPLIEESRPMQRLSESLAHAVKKRGPLLICGRPGTGKHYLAQVIHRRVCAPDAAFITIDCRTLHPSQSAQLLFGGPSWKASSSGFGLLHLAASGTLVLRHVEFLDLETQRLLLEVPGIAHQAAPTDGESARLVATTCADLAARAAAGRFNQDLAVALQANRLEMPTLAQRRQDVLPLARWFLEQLRTQTQSPVGSLSIAAENRLLDSRWSYRNAAELEEAIRVAVPFAAGAEIRPEHIFTGPAAEDAPVEFDLQRTPLGKPQLRRWLLLGARAGVLLFFLLLAVLCLRRQGVLAQTANWLTWGLWWPGLLVLFLGVGRVWCAVCPLSSGARLTRLLLPGRRPPPERLNALSPWLIMLLFILIVWTEHIFHMLTTPLATGVLLLCLLGSAMALGMVFEREVWCRYLCPLGNLSAALSRSAIASVHSTASICATKCTTHDCFKGTPGDRNGCPVFHHPLYSRDASACKLCLKCLDVCPHDSAKLYLGLPLQGIWRQAQMGDSLVLLSMVAFFLAPVMLASEHAPWLRPALGYSLSAGLALGAGVLAAWLLPRLFQRECSADGSFVPRLAATSMLCSWGALFAYHVAHVPLLSRLHLSLRALPQGWPDGLPTQVPAVTLVQLAGVGLALLLTLVAGGHICSRTAASGERLAWTGWTAVGLAVALQTAVSVVTIVLTAPT